MNVISGLRNSGFLAQSAYSAEIAINDDLGRKISTTYLTTHQDLSDYYTTAAANTLSSMLSGAIDYVSANAGDDFPQSADEAIQAYQTNSSTYLTSHQDISYLMPKSESANFYPMTGNPSGFINDVEFEEINLSSFATSSQINELSGAIDYVSAHGSGGDSEVNNYVYNNSASIDETVTAYQTNSASYLTEVPTGYAVESAFEYNSNDLITAYNGSAFAGQGGGGDVPTGTMNVSGLEYNAVNEISAYNGSAIAQYGAEKQWLVHDGTLVHLSNSAQYALGVNVSALQRLMGIDETVLFENADGVAFSGATVNLNESWLNFNSVKMTTRFFNEGAGQKTITELIPSDVSPYQGVLVGGFNDTYGYSSAAKPFLTKLAFHSNSAGDTVYLDKCWILGWNTTAWDERQNGRLYKVVGIGRKQ